MVLSQYFCPYSPPSWHHRTKREQMGRLGAQSSWVARSSSLLAQNKSLIQHSKGFCLPNDRNKHKTFHHVTLGECSCPTLRLPCALDKGHQWLLCALSSVVWVSWPISPSPQLLLPGKIPKLSFTNHQVLRCPGS